MLGLANRALFPSYSHCPNIWIGIIGSPYLSQWTPLLYMFKVTLATAEIDRPHGLIELTSCCVVWFLGRFGTHLGNLLPRLNLKVQKRLNAILLQGTYTYCAGWVSVRSCLISFFGTRADTPGGKLRSEQFLRERSVAQITRRAINMSYMGRLSPSAGFVTCAFMHLRIKILLGVILFSR